jgi:hypothetical protein
MSQQSTPAALPDFKGLLEYLVHENRIEAPAGGAAMKEDSGYGTSKPSDPDDMTQQDTGARSPQNRATTGQAATGEATPPVPPVLELNLRRGEPDRVESVSVAGTVISRRRRRSRRRRSSGESVERQQTVHPTKKPRTDKAKQNREDVAKSGGVCVPCRVTNSQVSQISMPCNVKRPSDCVAL